MNKTVTARAPINIALIKYWGKADPKLVLPYNPSISLSLSVFETITCLSDHPGDDVVFTLNGRTDETMKQRLIPFLKQFTGGENPQGLLIESINTGPTAAGLASSASAFAALAKAADAVITTVVVRMRNWRSGRALAPVRPSVVYMVAASNGTSTVPSKPSIGRLTTR
ncbi:MAG: hypothetical protein MZU97_19665 [Bacillus subtilis]|nr:hypothetical protein [Bacillus subtilis]